MNRTPGALQPILPEGRGQIEKLKHSQTLAHFHHLFRCLPHVPVYHNASSRRTVTGVQQYVQCYPTSITNSNFMLPPAGRRTFSQSATRRSYADTIQNLLIRKDTRVLCQGFTGKTVITQIRWGKQHSLMLSFCRVLFM